MCNHLVNMLANWTYDHSKVDYFGTLTIRTNGFYMCMVLITIILLTTDVTNGQAVTSLSFTSDAAEQSSLGNIGNALGHATRAINGNTRTCSRTQEEDNPWWRGELEQEYNVKTVIITNERANDQAEKLEGAVISVGSCLNDTAIAASTSECGTVSHGQATSTHGQPIRINCQSGISGKYVYITIPGELKTLGLCEVEVQGSEIPADTRSTITFSSPIYTALESDGSVELMITRSGETSTCSSFGISTHDGTATSTLDFIAEDGGQMFQFPPGELSTRVSVGLVDDMDIESMETFTVQLQNLMGIEIGDMSTAEVHIEDDDSPTTPEPTTTPSNPTTTPIVPTTTPTVPATTPTVPATTPTVPPTTPTVPPTTPTVPPTTPTVPPTTPTVPPTTPTVPPTTPTVPPTTPTVPPTTPTVPPTTPTVPPTTPTVPPTTPTVSPTTPTVSPTAPTVPPTTPTVPPTTPTVPPTTPTVPPTTSTVSATTPTIQTTTPTIQTIIPTVATTVPTVATTPQTGATTPQTVVTTPPTVVTTPPTVATTPQTVVTTPPTVTTMTPGVPTTTPTVQTPTPTIPTTPMVLTTTPTVQTTTQTVTTSTMTVPTTATVPTTTSTVATTKPNSTTKPASPVVTNKTSNIVFTSDPDYYDVTTDLMTDTMISGSTSKQIVDSCPKDVTVIKELVLTWSPTLASESENYVGSLEKCADYSSKAGEPKGFRLCRLVGNVAQWNPPSTNECFEGMEMNEQIERLAMTTVTSENVEVISSDLVDLTEDPDDLDPEGLASAADVLETITMENYTSEMVITNVLQVVDNLLDVNQEEFRKAQASNVTSTRLLMALESEITMLRNNGSNYTFEGENIEITILQLPRQAFVNGLKFPSVDGEDSDYDKYSSRESIYNREGQDSRQAAIYLPEAILNFVKDEMIAVSFATYENSKLFQSRTPHLVVGGKIVSATVSNARVVGLPKEEPVKPSFVTQNINNIVRKPLNEYATDVSPQCVFWNLTAANGVGDWSTEGCSLASYGDEEAICHCNHLTNFAVLLDVRGGEIHNLTLDLVSKIGCAISIAALIITILTYLNIRNLRTKQPQRILLHLSFSLLGLYSVFLIGIEQTHSYFGCIVVAILLHYFTLTSTCWMAVEAINMYFVFVRVLNSRVSHFLTKASAFAWGLPMVIVAVIAGLDHTQYYNDHHCFLRPGIVFSFAVILLVVLLLMFNFFIFFVVMHRLTCGRKSKRTNKKLGKEVMKRLQNIVIISVLLGLTWTFGLLTAVGSASFQLQLLFSIFNSLQGFFLFLLFCVRQKEVRLAWRAWFTGSTIRRMSISSYLNSRKRSSALSLTKNAHYRTRDSRHLDASVGNLSHISLVSPNSTLQTVPVITEIDISNNEDNKFSTLSTTAGSTLSTFNGDDPYAAFGPSVGRFDGIEDEETMSNDSGVPNVNGEHGEEEIREDQMAENVIVYV